MAVDKIAICNEALAELPADAITDFDERGVAAEWCGRLYASTLSDVLARHDWKMPTSRVILASVTNDRPAEWAQAYALPENCLTELRVLPSFTLVEGEVPLLTGMVLTPWLSSQQTVPLLYRFLVSGSTLYANVEAAQLEYISDAANEQSFRPLFRRAFVLELASRLCMPVKKERARQGDLIKMAETAMSRAMADDMNRDDFQSEYGTYTNATEMARQGWTGSQLSYGIGSPFGPWGS